MLKGEIRNLSSLTGQDRERMFEIMGKHYTGVSEPTFLKDLAEKDGALVLEDDSGLLQGFSTYMFIHTTYEQDPIVALFSGDTIIDRAYWGSPALFNVFGRLLYRLMQDSRGKRPYWFLITKGFRTYLMLPLFFHNFYPRYDKETPPYERGLIEHLANTKYDGHFDRIHGIIRTDSYSLRDKFSEIPESKLRNPNVRFFLEKNPGYMRGDELACVCEISMKSFRRRTKTLVRP